MGLNFRKSFKILPGTRLNVSKRGLGASFGVPGARISFGKKGVQKTVGIPGTGLSYTSKVFKKRKKGKNETSVGEAVEFLVTDQVEAMQNPRSSWPGYLLVGICFLIGFAVVVRLLK
jgi:hypothetical protein